MRTERYGVYIWLLVGTFLMAAGIQMFYAPAGVVAGGATGLGIVLNQLGQRTVGLPVPLWLVNVAWDVPLLFLARKTMGKTFFLRTLWGCGSFSIALYGAEYLPAYGGDMVLVCLFGGTFVGIGAGLVLRGMAATGGTDLAAALIHDKFPKISVAQVIFALDSIIILIGMAVFGIEKGMYAIASVFLTSKWVDTLLEGITFSRGALIISQKWKEIGRALLEQADRGVTAFRGRGLYTNEEKEILLCVFSPQELVQVKEIILGIDKNAFVFVTDMREVMGEGFQRMK